MREVLEVESSGCWLPMMVGILMILCVKTYLLRVTGWKFHSTSLPSFEKDVQCTDPLEAREVVESWKSARNCPCCDWCTRWFQNCSKFLRRCSFLGPRLFGHAIISCHMDLVADRFPTLVSGNITATAHIYGATCAANMVETVSPLHHASPCFTCRFPNKTLPLMAKNIRPWHLQSCHAVPCRAMPPGHKWLWRFMRRRDFGRFEACLDAMRGDLAAKCGHVMSWDGGEIIEMIRNDHL